MTNKWKKSPPKPPEDLRTLKAKQQDEWYERVQELMEAGLLKNDKVYVGQSDTHLAYVYVLDTGEGAKPALEYVSKETGKPETWVDDVKHNPVGKQLLSRVMNITKDHPTSISMRENKVLTTSTKRAIKGSSSISSTLNALSDIVNLNNRLNVLENKVDTLEGEVYTLQDAIGILVEHAGTTEERLDTLESNVTKLSKSQLKDEAKKMRDKGFTQQEIAGKLGKSQATISSWLKEE